MKWWAPVAFIVSWSLYPPTAHSCDFTWIPLGYTEFRAWPCGKVVDFAEGPSALPLGWLSSTVTPAAGIWNNALGRIDLRPFVAGGNNEVEVYWMSQSGFWPADAADAAGSTDVSYSSFPVINNAYIIINLYNYQEATYATGSGCPQPNQISLMHVCLHEWGHAIGMRHVENCGGNIMDRLLDWGDCTIGLGPSDVTAADILYKCSTQNYLAVGLGQAACSLCFSGTVDAYTRGFRVIDGVCSWSTIYEDETAEYVIETSQSLDGPWSFAAIEAPGIGDHVVSISRGGGHRFARLVEVETSGARRVWDSGRIWSSDELFAARRSVERHELPSLPPVAGQPLTTGCTDWAAAPDYVIFTVGSLFATVDCTIGSLRESQGHAVRVIDVDASAQGSVADFITTTIQSYYSTFGTKYFHIVGSWEDELSSSLWQANDYWLAKQDAFQQYRARFERPELTGTIPPVLTAADGVAPTAASTPYVYSDQPYGDLDADGVPDVVVTRWPFSTTGQVQAAYYKLEEYHLFPAPGKVQFLGHDAVGLDWEKELVRFSTLDEISRLEEASSSHTTATFFSADLVGGALTVETADSINSFRPDVMFLLGTSSQSYMPASWFRKSDTAVPWQMSMLEPFNYARLIVAASCDAADYEDFTEYGAPSCVDFLAAPYLGAMEWIGPTGASMQAANHLVSVRLIEEMYANPYRPMAESWLFAMQRAYADVAVSSDFDELIPTLRSYVFLGDPLAPLASLPKSSITAYARRSNGALNEMPGSFAVACPERDADQLVVEVKLNAAQVVGTVESSDLALSQPSNPGLAFFPDGQEITADSTAVLFAPETAFPSGYYKTTFTVASLGGCGVDSALVSLQGIPLGYAQLNIRSPDMVINAIGTRGKVGAADFSEFGLYTFSSICDCVYEKPYAACADFAAPDTSVTMPDFAFFGVHYDHGDPQGAGNPSSPQLAVSAGSVRLEFVEEQPLTGPHVLRADVILEGVGPFTAAVVALANGNDRLEYIEWSPDATFPGESMCTSLERDGAKQVFLGVLGSKNASSGIARLGTATFRVHSDDPVALTEADFALLTADILDVAGQVRQVSPANRRTSFEAPSYRNELAQNYPNPFNPTTTIAFSLAGASDADLRIYDVRGAAVRTLVHERRQAGLHRVDWDGHNDRGQPIASGVYFYKLVAGSFVDTKKMTILK